MMNSRELMGAAMRRQPTPRIPVMPQITLDAPIRLYAAEYGGDWLDGMKRILEKPALEYEYIIRLATDIRSDGVRLFIKPGPMQIERQGDDLIALNPHSGERVGKINAAGGGNLVLDRPPAPISTLDEACQRLQDMAAIFTDEKIDALRQARARIPHLFAAGAPGNMAMSTYFNLRGAEQGMLDLFERPDFVQAVFDLQVEAAISQAEKLLDTGIDALYIGDPSSSPNLISPRHFKKFSLPAFQKFCTHFKNRDILIYIHVCGNATPILEMLADTGVDVVEPLDPMGGAGVSVADAKRRIGDRVGLMGGLGTDTLDRGAPADVRAEAIQKCREGGPHGFILAAGCGVPPNTPMENLQAMTEVAVESLWK
jgi:hypothetical protein